MVVVQQYGKVIAFNDNPEVSSSHIIADLSERLATVSGEQGLLGLAFDPQFTTNRFVYLYYTEKDTNTSIVTRLPWDRESDTLDVSREKVVLKVEQPFETHNAGMIMFGTDNNLYIALGDGGDGGDPFNLSQDRSSLLGSVLRINVHPENDTIGYLIPEDNPFVGESGVREEIYAYGFRNPFRMSFDRQTGDLWLGDVGQAAFEEINLVKAGGNYGWRVYEGTLPKEPKGNTLPDSAFTPPIYEYTHDVGLAVIGGYVYRGAVSSLQGRYLFSDFYSGVITGLTLEGETVTAVDDIASIEGPTSFGEARDGELLVVSRYGGIFKFVENRSTIEFPPTLSQTGLFDDLSSLSPVSGLVEYSPSHSFWSDGTSKRRWIGVPDSSTIDFTADDWTFPLGSVSVKHFEIETIENAPGSARRLETRVMYNTTQGWQGFSYRWNQEQSEALLSTERQSEELTIAQNDGTFRTQQYDYPGRADCGACHNEASTYLLGLETAQINSEFDYGLTVDNQLRSWNNIGYFSFDIGDTENYLTLPAIDNESATIASRARAYLDVNCSVCHQPGGGAPTGIDLRKETPIADMNAINLWPKAGQLGVSDPRIIAAGSKERSILWYRMQTLGENRMPPIASHVVDEVGLQVIGDWIDSMDQDLP